MFYESSIKVHKFSAIKKEAEQTASQKAPCGGKIYRTEIILYFGLELTELLYITEDVNGKTQQVIVI